jgi:hypothetical protein
MVALPPDAGMTVAAENVLSRRLAGKRIGVLWPGEARTANLKLPCIVLDISVAGAKVRSDDTLLGNLNRLWLSIDFLDLFECANVWQRNGRVGLRFIGDCPTMGRLQELLDNPPYLRSA